MQLPNWINLELTNECNKSCYFCGRAEARREKTMKTGFMPLDMIQSVLNQFTGSVIQFNKDGEPLLYPHLKKVGEMCSHVITNIVTNGKLLMDRKEELKDNFTTITVSVIEDDEQQFENVKSFIEFTESPRVLVKFLGDYDNPEYRKLGLQILRRSIHNPAGDSDYIQNRPPIPEIGVCIDFLTKPSISWEGDFHICNRYDDNNDGVIGNVNLDPIDFIWNGPLRNQWLEYHIKGQRDKIKFCSKCQYWGFPAA